MRSESSANRRAYLEFDMDQLPAHFDAFDDPLDVTVQVVEESSGRTIKLDEVTGDLDEAALTWNTQPTIGLAGIGSQASDPDVLIYDLLGLSSIVPTSGPFRVRLRDETEDEVLAAQQRLASREHGSLAPPVLNVGYTAAEHRALPSALTVRRSATRDLADGVLPRVHAEVDLVSELDVVFTRHLAATVAPSLTGLAVQAQAQGIIARRFLEPLRDLRRISDEAGSLVTRVQEGATEELRRIVQLVAAGTPAFGLGETPEFPGTSTSAPDTLRRGDAVLFALGRDTWVPGARVTWQGQDYSVAGVLGTERLEGQVLYQEIGLRRLSVCSRARVTGVVG